MGKAIPVSLLVILLFLLPAKSESQDRQHIIDSLQRLLNQTMDPGQKINLYAALSKNTVIIDPQKSKEMARHGLAMASRVGVDSCNGRLYRYLGDIGINQDSMDIAESYYVRAVEYFTRYDQISDLTLVTNILGNIQFMRGRYAEAMDHYLAAIALAEKLDMMELLAPLYHNIGAINVNSLGDYNEAIRNFTKALDLYQTLGDTLSMATTYKNIGETWFEMGDTVQSRYYLERARTFFERDQNSTGMAQCDLGMAVIAYGQGDYLRSLHYFENAHELLNRRDSYNAPPTSTLLSSCYAGIAENKLALGLLNEAMLWYDKAWQLSVQNHQVNLMTRISKGISDSWTAGGNADSALVWFRIYKAWSDTLLDEENIRRMAFRDAQYRFEQRLSEEKQQQAIREEQEHINYLILALIIGGLAAVIVVMLLLLKLWRSRLIRSDLQQKALQNELDTRNKELTTHVMYQVRKNEFILSITEKLKTIVYRSKAENRPIIEEIIHALDKDSADTTWKDFEIRFHRVHTDFNKKLLQQYPDLTANELRLCAFLRLNLSTKEISTITYQSVSSIDTARFRLRQKMGLEKDDNLVALLMKF